MRPKREFVDTPEAAEMRARLKELAQSLLALHKRLIDAARDEYIRERGPIASPYALLNLLTSDLFFAWLRPLSEIIVKIDELVEIELDRADVKAALETLDRMITGQTLTDFSSKYVEALQQNVEIAGFHASVRATLAQLRPLTSDR